MSLRNSISEFLLFRWLFGKHQHKGNNDSPIRKSSDSRGYSINSYGRNVSDRDSQYYNDFHDEQDDYDMMDDF